MYFQENNRLEVSDENIQASIEKIMKKLIEEIEEVKKKIHDHIEQYPDLQEKSNDCVHKPKFECMSCRDYFCSQCLKKHPRAGSDVYWLDN